MGINARLCYLGVDAEFFHPDPAITREKRVLSVGSFHPAKRHEFVVDAVATIPQARRPAVHVIGHNIELGPGNAGTYADELCRRAVARDVVLTVSHEVSDEALRNAYRHASVVASAPHLEPFGLIPLEAMACGTPVVGVSEAGLRETVQHEVTGLLTERHPGVFGSAIDQVLCNANLAGQFGQNGREVVQKLWTWRRSADVLEELAAPLMFSEMAAPI
jgi:glycosyltransferase involved in cell wall biosynthesis